MTTASTPDTAPPRGHRTEPARFALVQFLFWSSIVTFEAFMVPYLRFRGYTPGQIGPIMGAIFGLSVVGQPLLGALSDRVRSPKYLIAGALVIAAVAVSLVPVVAHSYLPLLLIALIYSLTGNSLPAIFDGWIMARRDHNPRVNYGIARGFGSAGYAAGALVFGFVTERYGPGIVFPAYFGIVLTTVVMALGVPSVARPARRAAAARRHAAPQAAAVHAATPHRPRAPFRHITTRLRAVLHNREYLLLLVASFFAFVGLRAGLTFIPILIEELDGSLTDVGLTHSVAAVSEIPFFFLSSLIFRRIRGPRLIATLLGILSLRLLAYTFLTAAPQILILQLSHGLTFGLYLAATVEYIHRIAPPQHRSFFQALAPSVYFGLGSIAGSWLGGIVIEAYSVLWLYRGAALVAAIGAAILFFESICNRRKNMT